MPNGHARNRAYLLGKLSRGLRDHRPIQTMMQPDITSAYRADNHIIRPLSPSLGALTSADIRFAYR